MNCVMSITVEKQVLSSQWKRRQRESNEEHIKVFHVISKAWPGLKGSSYRDVNFNSVSGKYSCLIKKWAKSWEDELFDVTDIHGEDIT